MLSSVTVKTVITILFTPCFDTILLVRSLDKPGPPGVPQVSEITDTSMSLNWKPPSDDGGAPIEGYVLEYKMEGGRWKLASTDTLKRNTFRVEGLMTNMEYQFRASAINKAGQGPCSDHTQKVKAKAPLGERYIIY